MADGQVSGRQLFSTARARTCLGRKARAKRTQGRKAAETTWPGEPRGVQYTSAYLEVLELERRLILWQSICRHRAICCQSRAAGGEIRDRRGESREAQKKASPSPERYRCAMGPGRVVKRTSPEIRVSRCVQGADILLDATSAHGCLWLVGDPGRTCE